MNERLFLTLPYPPSGQHRLGMRFGRFYRTAAYRRYLAAVMLAAQARKPRFPEGRLWVTIVLRPPTRRRADLDNAAKSILDALGEAGIWTDDSQIDALTVEREWGHAEPGALVGVRRLP